ncbi:crAss001_48 related protein [Streptococcus equinus]|uniref:crAss001_48 related protein n=1 Tax=Streptococcus equinus TaxID=1335 RepID=UPI00088CEFEF|nr:hypothetical protein [Streptococcus equinus]QBX24710.1 hypothetical protein Javan202_0031 [Streptococcus phage Javan202]SDQ66936.1 hypothetical protein SAMN04488495_1795 [Streptococcus equinus]SEN67746.1 hypothetical protein SAMN04488496_0883 [Streptococcus equinus]
MEAYKERMVNEYWELMERSSKLGSAIVQKSQDELNCPVELLKAQYSAMETYRNILRVRAEIEGIEL